MKAKSLRGKLKVEAITYPDRAKKIELDLSQARTDYSLVQHKQLPSDTTFYSLSILKKGTGSWTMKMVFDDGSYVEYTSDEVDDGYVIERRFIDLKFTNSAQTEVENPKFIVDWFSSM